MINDVMTFKEAAKRWGKNDSTLRKLVDTDRLVKDFDYRKSAGTWLITYQAMVRLYGEPPKIK